MCALLLLFCLTFYIKKVITSRWKYDRLKIFKPKYNCINKHFLYRNWTRYMEGNWPHISSNICTKPTAYVSIIQFSLNYCKSVVQCGGCFCATQTAVYFRICVLKRQKKYFHSKDEMKMEQSWLFHLIFMKDWIFLDFNLAYSLPFL